MNNIILEIRGGLISSIISEEDVLITIVDHDLIESEGGHRLDTLRPDLIVNFEEGLNRIIEEDGLELAVFDELNWLVQKEDHVDN